MLRSSLFLAASLLALGACEEQPFPYQPYEVSGLTPVAQLSSGPGHRCAVLRNGNLACWGNNGYGQLGIEIDETQPPVGGPRYVPTREDPVEVAAGGTHSCARFADGSIDCWGANVDASLGFAARCAIDDNLCVSLPETLAVENAVAIAAGGPGALDTDASGLPLPASFSCAILSDETVQCWGANGQGQAGPDRKEAVRAEPTLLLDADGEPYTEVIGISLGRAHACLFNAGGELYCWGADESLQAAPAAARARIESLSGVIAVDAGDTHTCAATELGEVYCWGRNLNGQAGSTDANQACGSEGYADCVRSPQRIEGVSNAVAVSVGERHSCALTSEGTVYCWGSNQTGQLGVAQPSLSLPPQRVALPKSAVEISVSTASTCVRHSDGTVSCWG